MELKEEKSEQEQLKDIAKDIFENHFKDLDNPADIEDIMDELYRIVSKKFGLYFKDL